MMSRDSIPPTGLSLPFISAGGTSLMVFMGAIGVLMNIANNEKLKFNFKNNVFNEKKSKNAYIFGMHFKVMKRNLKKYLNNL